MKQTLLDLTARLGSRTLVLALAAVILINLVLMVYWDDEPGLFDVRAVASERAAAEGAQLVIGYTTAATLVEVVDRMLDKPGGYLSNDIMPPSVFMDNVPNWEFGVLVQVRDLAKSLRNDMSRSQTQSVEDPDLQNAEPLFSVHNDRWVLPASEGEYRKGARSVERYMARLVDPADRDAQFYARADNLRDWLALVEKRLGNLSQRLSASVGQTRVNVDLGGDTAGTSSTQRPSDITIKTPWLRIDDEFYEARGSCWALIQFLRAAEVDFHDVLAKKNALVSLRQIIRELEGTQDTIWSPMVLNGSGFGFFANHSLVMASYVSRANAALIDLRKLLEQG